MSSITVRDGEEEFEITATDISAIHFESGQILVRMKNRMTAVISGINIKWRKNNEQSGIGETGQNLGAGI